MLTARFCSDRRQRSPSAEQEEAEKEDENEDEDEDVALNNHLDVGNNDGCRQEDKRSSVTHSSGDDLEQVSDYELVRRIKALAIIQDNLLAIGDPNED